MANSRFDFDEMRRRMSEDLAAQMDDAIRGAFTSGFTHTRRERNRDFNPKDLPPGWSYHSDDTASRGVEFNISVKVTPEKRLRDLRDAMRQAMFYENTAQPAIEGVCHEVVVVTDPSHRIGNRRKT